MFVFFHSGNHKNSFLLKEFIL